MRQTARDALALLRCAHLGASLSHALSFVRHVAADTVRAFDDVVAPLLEDTVKDLTARRHARQAFLSASIKGGFLIYSYARMIRHPYSAELTALGGSFTRLYDDLLDESESARLAERMSDLFHGRRFDPLNDMERLLATLFYALQEQLGRPRDDQVYSALYSLHYWQVLSQQQKLPEISAYALKRITANKGGLANVALFALVRQAMAEEEFGLIMELGAIFQLMDDYLDIVADQTNGLHTLFTRGETTMANLANQLRHLSARIINFYGTGARPFLTVVYILLVAAFLKRLRNPALASGKTTRNTARSPLGLLTFHGGGTLPS